MKSNFVWALLGTVFISLLTQKLYAEPVLIRNVANMKGQGWLFGSPVDASCWIVTPKHVIEQSKNGPVKNFLWSDIEGHEGTGLSPVAPVKGLDLAFAKITGRQKGQCLSRLGTDDITHFVSRQPMVEAMVLQKTFVQPRQMRLRDFDARYIRFMPVTEAAARNMRPGLSGSPLVLRTEGVAVDRPIGLVLQVSKDQQTGFALRFDEIKKIFLTQVANDQPAAQQTNVSGNFTILNTQAVTLNAQSVMENIKQEEGCWVAKPPEGKRSFSFDVIMDKTAKSLSGIIVKFDKSCGAQPGGIILETRSGDQWATAGICKLNPEQATCRLPNQTADRLRVSIIKRDGTAVALKQLILLP